MWGKTKKHCVNNDNVGVFVDSTSSATYAKSNSTKSRTRTTPASSHNIRNASHTSGKIIERKKNTSALEADKASVSRLLASAPANPTSPAHAKELSRQQSALNKNKKASLLLDGNESRRDKPLRKSKNNNNNNNSNSTNKVRGVGNNKAAGGSGSGTSAVSKKDPRICDSFALRGKCYSKGGPHWRVGEAGEYGNTQHQPKKWHPPMGMHMIRAEMLVYSYVHIILDAVFTVRKDVAEILEIITSSTGASESAVANSAEASKSNSKAVSASSYKPPQLAAFGQGLVESKSTFA